MQLLDNLQDTLPLCLQVQIDGLAPLEVVHLIGTWTLDGKLDHLDFLSDLPRLPQSVQVKIVQRRVAGVDLETKITTENFHYRTVWCFHISVEFIQFHHMIMHRAIPILKNDLLAHSFLENAIFVNPVC